ncbi:MAG: Lrp/AsnC family transcriptional regulator [Herbiconiux sp.]|nr:Lrp/AsnC family transcriptional regulator [Herbiconiux sp.]
MPELDRIDRIIIGALESDGRRPYNELAELVGLTPGGVRKRVMRLIEDGTLKVIGVTDPLRLGFEAMAVLNITVEGDPYEIADALAAIPQVVYVVVGGGGFDILAEVLAKDSQHLGQVVSGTVRAIPGVKSLTVFTYYTIHTHRFTWGEEPLPE